MISKVQQESCLAHRKHAADIGYYSILKWRDLLTSPPCMHTCTYILTCIHMHALADTHTYTYTHVHMHMHIHLPLTTSHSHENNQTNGLFLSALARILNFFFLTSNRRPTYNIVTSFIRSIQAVAAMPFMPQVFAPAQFRQGLLPTPCFMFDCLRVADRMKREVQQLLLHVWVRLPLINSRKAI